MYPVLIDVGGFTVNSYGVMLALAFICAGAVARWQFKKRGVAPDLVYGLVIAAVIGGLLGAKIHYLIIHPESWPQNLLSGSGLVWYGGMVLAILAVILTTVFSSQRLGAVMDGGAVAVALGYAIGRIGCFLHGCCHGKPTDLPWGITFTEGAPPTTVPVHPTQLYESLAALCIFALLAWVIGPRFKREGPLMFVFALLIGVERFLVEFVRTNPPVALGLTQQQWISIALVVGGTAGAWWFGARGRLRPAVSDGAAADATAVDTAGAVSAPALDGKGGTNDDRLV